MVELVSRIDGDEIEAEAGMMMDDCKGNEFNSLGLFPLI